MVNFFLFYLCISIQFVNAKINAIYGEDNRSEAYESPELEKQIRSVAVMVDSYKLLKSGDDFTFQGVSLKEKHNLCIGERFADQPTLGSCTGSLVAEDVILTAAHCIKNDIECAKQSWIFDYQLDEFANIPEKFPTKNVFGCKKVIHVSSYPSLEIDFSLIRLDRKVIGRSPLKLANVPGKLPFGKEILMLGFPSGLPMKVANDAQVFLSTPTSFKTNLDAFSGNSGAPVFDKTTMEVMGVLISGKMDYENSGHCKTLKYSPQMSMQETVTNTKLILDALKSNL